VTVLLSASPSMLRSDRGSEAHSEMCMQLKSYKNIPAKGAYDGPETALVLHTCLCPVENKKESMQTSGYITKPFSHAVRVKAGKGCPLLQSQII
jgi:hypothetical protein